MRNQSFIIKPFVEVAQKVFLPFAEDKNITFLRRT